MSKTLCSLGTLIVALGLLAGHATAAEDARQLRVATFSCDVTPPLGHRLISGDALLRVEYPLLAKGIVLDDGAWRYVLCSVDWCELCNSAHDLFRSKLAAAVGTEASLVAVQTVHQHTAPLMDDAAQRLLDQTKNPPVLVDLKFLAEVTDRLAAAAKESLARLEPFDAVGFGQAKVDRVAATRRVVGPDGKILVRWSTCTDPALRAMPEGLIDPMLKTITLARGDKPLVRLHYYATHPQTPYGDGRASSDFPGMAREKLQEKEHVFQVYFTGCGGDITVGKYNDGSPQVRPELAGRLSAGMEASITATRFVPAKAIQWRTSPLRLPLRTDAAYSLQASRAKLEDAEGNFGSRTYGGAIRMAFCQRIEQPIEVSCMAIGPVRIVHLPGEPMVEFQLYAQKLLPDAFVAVAGYGDCGPGYVCTAAAVAEGGYEPTDSMLAPQAEADVKAAIRRLLVDISP